VLARLEAKASAGKIFALKSFLIENQKSKSIILSCLLSPLPTFISFADTAPTSVVFVIKARAISVMWDTVSKMASALPIPVN
jgi:hypothetical protein